MHDISENRRLEFLVSPKQLKQQFYSNDFSNFLQDNESPLQNCHLYMKKVVKTEREEGEAEPEEALSFVRIDEKECLKEVLRGTTVKEYPTLYVLINE